MRTSHFVEPAVIFVLLQLRYLFVTSCRRHIGVPKQSDPLGDQDLLKAHSAACHQLSLVLYNMEPLAHISSMLGGGDAGCEDAADWCVIMFSRHM